jgi:hypothetical protein
LTREEDKQRRKALYLLLSSKATKKFGNEECRHLGDAVFVLLCPQDCEIVTMNIKDFQKFGAALKKKVRQLRLTKRKTDG